MTPDEFDPTGLPGWPADQVPEVDGDEGELEDESEPDGDAEPDDPPTDTVVI